MATLHTAIAPTSTYSASAGFGNIAGYTASVTIAAGSFVLLIATVPWDRQGDATTDHRFARGGSPIGPVQTTGWTDSSSTDEGADGTIAWIDSPGAGTFTYTLQADETNGTMAVDTSKAGMFLIIEIPAAEANLYTVGPLTSADSAPGTYDVMTGMTKTFTPTSGSVNLIIASHSLKLASDNTAKYQFSIGGTVVGYGENIMGTDSSIHGGSSTMMMAFDDQGASSTTFALEWEDIAATPNVDNSHDRYFQVLELLNATLHHNASGTVQTSSGSYQVQAGMTASKSLGDAASTMLMLASIGMDPSSAAGGDCNTLHSFSYGGTREGGASGQGYEDSTSNQEFSSYSLAWAKDPGDTSPHTYALEWRDTHNAVDTYALGARLQLIELAPASAASPPPDTPGGGFQPVDVGIGDPGVAGVPQTLHTIEQGIAA